MNYVNKEYDYSKKFVIDKEKSKEFRSIITEKPWLKHYTKDAINAKLPECSAYSYIYDRNKENLDKIALQYFNVKISYKELFERIDDCVVSLKKIGIKKGDIVTICMPTTPETVYLFYALSKIGAISNMIDPRKSPKEIEDYVNETNSILFFGIDTIKNKYNNLKENTSIKNIILCSPYESFDKITSNLLKFKDKINTKDFSKEKNNYLLWKDFYQKRKLTDKIENIEYEKDMPLVIVYTGGTTGKSKGVILSNDTINCGAKQCEVCGLDFSDKGTWLDIMPPFVAYGLGNGLHLPLSMGMKVVLIPKFKANEYDKLLMKYKPNHIAGTPSHYGYLLKSNLLKNKDLSFVKTPIVGGDKMDYTLEEEVNKYLEQHNCPSKIVKGYGMSEVNAAVSVCVNNDINKLKSVGIPLSHSIIGIFDPETGKELTYNEDGEVRIAGPNVMLGYYNNKEEEEHVLHKDENGINWVYSGDLGCIDEDGCLFVKGRYKEMIIRPDGFKVFPSLIEETILKHPNVSECKVVGCRDYTERQGELPKAFITLKNNNVDIEKNLEEIKLLCNKELAEYFIPFDYEILDNFPYNLGGKIDTLKLKEDSEKKLHNSLKQLKKIK